MSGAIEKIVGIDPSLTGTGMCVSKSYLAGSHTETALIAPKIFGVKRLIYIRNNILLWCEGATLVTIEGYAYGKQNQAHQMGELGGVLRVALTEDGIPWVEVAPTAVKKFATGAGNANKEAVAVGVYKKWGREFPNNNEADAYVLMEIGRAFLGGEPIGGLLAYQREVIETIRKGADQ